MNNRRHSLGPNCASLRIVIGALGAAGTLVCAAATTPPPDTIVAHARHYTAGGRAYIDLDQLEAAVRATRPASVRIVSCEPEATRAWLAAVHRFDNMPMELDVDASAPACGAAAVPVSSSAAGGGLAGIDDDVVSRYWERRMP